MMVRVPLDPLLRGLCEQQIDEKLSGGEIQYINDFVDALDLPPSSKEHVALGLFLGTVYNELATQCMKVYNRPPEREEIYDYHLILKRRAYEVREKIKELSVMRQMEDVEGVTNKPGHDPENAGRVIQSLDNQLASNMKGLYDLEDAPRVRDEALPDIEIDFSARSSKKRRRSILGIPIVA